MQDDASVQVLGGIGNTAEAKQATRDFLVQKGFIKSSSPAGLVDEEIFVPPLILGDQTSKTVPSDLQHTISLCSATYYDSSVMQIHLRLFIALMYHCVIFHYAPCSRLTV